MKKITFLSVLLLFAITTGFAQNARVQVIHNSPDLAASTVDVYLNGTLLLDNFAFRTATPFVDVPAGVEISIDVAPSNSTSSADGIYNLTATLSNNEKYIVVANGIVSATGYSTAPNFALNAYSQARETANDPTKTDVLVNHGSPDAPTVDVVETSVPAGTIVDDISFPAFAGYLELPNLDFTLDVRDASGTTTVASYLAPLQTLNLAGAAVTVLASGFLDPTQNSNGPAFGLWAATAAGGALIPLPANTLGVQESLYPAFAIYPNPANSIISILKNANDIIDNVKIVDINGRVVLEFRSEYENLNISSLTKGVYIAIISGNNTVTNKKIVVNN